MTSERSMVVRVCAVVLLMALVPFTGYSQEDDDLSPRHFLGTSLFVLTNLIPDTGVFFYELDYGYKLTGSDTLLAGIDVYQFIAPMSTGWSDDTTYDGHVLSYGVIGGYQRFLWKGLFATQMVNPLVMDYYDAEGAHLQSGFMLLLATRVGWSWDIPVPGVPVYVEAAGEFNIWPVNTNVPQSFADLDDAYPLWVFAPALNLGIRL